MVWGNVVSDVDVVLVCEIVDMICFVYGCGRMRLKMGVFFVDCENL